MSQNQHLQDLNFDSNDDIEIYYASYREAAEQDSYFFSDFSLDDYLKIYDAEVES